MADVPTVTLNSGHEMPQLGFGVFKVPAEQTADIVRSALDAGYRSIDTAAMYGNEEGVGRAIAESDVPRDQIFVTTKLNNDAHGYDQALAAFEQSRRKLGLDVVDLYLIHWPLPARDQFVDTWRAFVKLRDEGLVCSIGVSNFQPAHLDRIIDESGVTPAVNQIELHPYLTQASLREYDTGHRIATEAWSPIARGGELLNDRMITSLADKYGKTPAQIVLRWHIEIGNVVIPKSATPSRIRENIDIFDIELDSEDVEAITGLDRDHRTGPNPDHFNP
jgi:diketogulonate reductase-like aldo/keto reductase